MWTFLFYYLLHRNRSKRKEIFVSDKKKHWYIYKGNFDDFLYSMISI